MKRKLAALLCSVMCISAFTGCSTTELAYLNMSREMIDSISACAVDGTMRAVIDFDGLNDFSKDMTETLYGEGYGTETGLTGKKSLKVDYDMNLNLEAMEYDMSFDVIYDGKTIDLGKMYYSLEKGVYVTSDTLWGVYQIYLDMADRTDSYIMSEAFAQDFRKVLAEEKYIELASMEQLTGVDMGEAMPEQDMQALYDAAFTFYEDVLDGFETGMVKQINGGYEIKADGHAVAQLLADLLHFVAEHPDQVITATETYMMAVLNSVEAGTPEETEEAKMAMAMMFEEARASMDDFVDAAAQMAVLVESMMQHPAMDMVLDGFQYVAKVKKYAGDYVSTAAYTLKHEDKTVCSLVTDSVLKKADVQIFFPYKAMTVEELEDKLAKLEEKYNPVTGVTVMWGQYGISDYADVYTMRSSEESVFVGGSYNWSELIIENDRAYLPLRMITEMLGEEVGWENSTKTPYVLQDGTRIDMKGKLKDDRAYVGIRDFEKLGYTVTYTAHKDEFDPNFSYKEVVIEK